MSDEYQSIPVAVARAAVQASGELEAIEGPQYLAHDEAAWQSYFIESQSATGHPILARVIVTRKGQAPREVVISWDEYAAELELNDPAWAEKRKQKPMSIFGAEVERHAYRVVFADVLAAAMSPRIVAGAMPPESWEPRNDRLMVVPDAAVAVRDWIAEVQAADAKALNALYDEAREAGALAKVEGLQAAIMDRMLTLGDKPTPQPRRVGDALAPKRSPGQGNRRRGKR